MPETTRHLRYPLETDTPDVPRDIKNLAEDVTAAMNKSALTGVIHAASVEATSGELVEMVGIGQTVTLPTPTLQSIVGVFSTNTGLTKVTASSGGIFGDFLPTGGIASVNVAQDQHVIFLADGSNWLVISGEPLNPNGYGAQVARSSKTAYVLSENRPCFVMMYLTSTGEIALGNLEIAGKFVGNIVLPKAAAGQQYMFGFYLPAGQKFEYNSSGELTFVHTSHVVM